MFRNFVYRRRAKCIIYEYARFRLWFLPKTCSPRETAYTVRLGELHNTALENRLYRSERLCFVENNEYVHRALIIFGKSVFQLEICDFDFGVSEAPSPSSRSNRPGTDRREKHTRAAATNTDPKKPIRVCRCEPTPARRRRSRRLSRNRQEVSDFFR